MTEKEMDSIMNGRCPYCRTVLYVADINEDGIDRLECWGDNRQFAIEHGKIPDETLEKCNMAYS